MTWSLRLKGVVAASVLAASTGLGSPAHAETIRQADLQFTFAGPDHFERIPPPNAAGLYAFKRTLPDATTLVVSLDRMGGTIDRKRLLSKELVPSKFGFPPNAKISLQDMPWRSFTLDALRVELPKDEDTVVAWICQIPLAKEAVQVTVIGSPSHEPEAREVFQSLVPTIEGKSNWLSDGERSYQLGLVVGSIAGAVIGILILFKVRQRKVAAGSSSAVGSS